MDWLTLLPPVLAITLAIWKKDVFIALTSAIFVSEFLLTSFAPGIGFVNSLERIIQVFGDAGNSRILLFSLLIGALLALMKDSGGVSAFVKKIQSVGFGHSKRQVGFIPSLTGIFIFIETNISILTSGILGQSLFDKFKMSRARLAFIIDSTSAPISVLILMNAWGAMLLGLIESYDKEASLSILIGTIPLNFYALIVLVMVFYTVTTTRVHGTLKTHEKQLDSQQNTPKAEEAEPEISATKARFMLFPLTVLIGGMLFFMYWTGGGDLMAGSGSKSLQIQTHP